MSNYTVQQKKDILTGKGQVGGKYCEAIDEDPYNSDDWHNRMPVSRWNFVTEQDIMTGEDGRVKVYWDEVFACWDGWDSHTYDAEYFDTMEIAVNSIWTRQAVDKVYDFIEGIKHAEYITINEDSKLSDKYNPTMLIDVQRDSGNGTCGSYLIDTFDMNELLKNLRDNVYPLLRGKEVDL